MVTWDTLASGPGHHLVLAGVTLWMRGAGGHPGEGLGWCYFDSVNRVKVNS